jgi:hypothetical protein
MRTNRSFLQLFVTLVGVEDMIHLGMSRDPAVPAGSDRPLRYLRLLHVFSVALAQMCFLREILVRRIVLHWWIRPFRRSHFMQTFHQFVMEIDVPVSSLASLPSGILFARADASSRPGEF